ncbi:hypothetical protein TCA2_0738 [Paenibacillus sp. TCA20]|nr:hypothetical protein TCA2_0738 [Paenibacillus sp. TCA20]
MRFLYSLLHACIAMAVIAVCIMVSTVLGIDKYLYLFFCAAALTVLFIGRNLYNKGSRAMAILCYAFSFVFLMQAWVL